MSVFKEEIYVYMKEQNVSYFYVGTKTLNQVIKLEKKIPKHITNIS